MAELALAWLAVIGVAFVVYTTSARRSSAEKNAAKFIRKLSFGKINL